MADVSVRAEARKALAQFARLYPKEQRGQVVDIVSASSRRRRRRQIIIAPRRRLRVRRRPVLVLVCSFFFFARASSRPPARHDDAFSRSLFVARNDLDEIVSLLTRFFHLFSRRQKKEKRGRREKRGRQRYNNSNKSRTTLLCVYLYAKSARVIEKYLLYL